MKPSVNVFRRSGMSIQALPGKQLLILAPADDGPVATPSAKTRGSDVISTFKGGQLVELACYAIKKYRIPVVCVRVDAANVTQFSAVTRTTGHGASVVTVDATSDTAVNASVVVMIVAGGTVGTAGITYRISDNGGNDFGELMTLGTASFIAVDLGATLPLKLDFTTATLAAGELISVLANVVSAGSFGALNTSKYPGATCTASASLKSDTYPNDDYQLRIRFIQGGTLGTAGATYQWSRDNGSKWSPEIDLGTALEIVLSEVGGATVTLGTAAQTIAAGAELSVRTVGPAFTTESATAALDAAFRYTGPWEWMSVGGCVTPGLAAVIDSAFVAAYDSAKERAWIGGWRLPGTAIPDGPAVSPTESDTAYQAAFNTAWHSVALQFGAICAGDCKVISAVTGYKCKRSPVIAVSPRQASVSPQTDIAQPTLGPLPDVYLEDDLGNTDCHDEAVDPGLDDMRAVTLRTFEGETGVYVTNPRVFTAAGSDIEMMPHLECFNLLARAERTYFRRRLSQDFFANAKTGKLRESDRRQIEAGANRAANAAMVTPGYITEQLTTVSPDDDMLEVRPATMTVEVEFVPKIYPKQINVTIAMVARINQGA